jgi:putative intracellular protease/amidase
VPRNSLLLNFKMALKGGFRGYLTLFLSLTTTSSAYAAKVPSNYGVAVYRGFEAIDVFGPMDIFNFLAFNYTMNLSILAETLDPVSTKPVVMNPMNSDFGQSIVPTHTFDNPPEDLEVLLVPGGIGTRSDNITAPVVDFVKATYPNLQYLISICTGGSIAAKSGVLDGRNATTNKKSWDWVRTSGSGWAER